MTNNFNLKSYLSNNPLLKESVTKFINEDVFKTGDRVIIKKDAQWTDDKNKISGMDEYLFNILKSKPSYVTGGDSETVYIAQERDADVDTFVAPEYLEKVS